MLRRVEDYRGIRNETDRRSGPYRLGMHVGRKPSHMGAKLKSGEQVLMRTLLRNVPTGLYVQSPEDWTDNPDEALDFKTMSQAIRFAEHAGLRKMELAFVSKQLCRFTE